MIGLDTNVLIRYLTRDDEAAFQVACDLIRSAELSGDWKNSSADFADAIIVAKYLQAGCTTAIASFDRKASALPGTTLLQA